MTHFVTITKADFEAMLQSIDPNYALVSGNEDYTCWEYIYEVATSVEGVGVRIYSTVDKRTGHTRDKGADAIRIVHWDIVNDRPVGKGKKILRVEGATTVQSRIAQRIHELTLNAGDITIINWEYVRAVLEDNKPYSGFAEKLLGGLDQYGSLTDNQLAYVLGETSPKGFETMEAKSKRKNPDFWLDYMAMQEDNGNGNGQPARHRLPERKTPRMQPASGPRPGERTLVNGIVCEVCGSPVYDTPSGYACAKGHGGINGYDPEDERTQAVAMEAVKDAAQAATGDLPTMTTDGYPYWQYPFPEFNPVQTATMPYADQPCNLVIGANTSAGKTICAELLMDHTLHQLPGTDGKRHNRVIYLSPLKSLTQEKYEDWGRRYPDREITILTGDYTLSDTMKAKLAKSDIIVMTSEMCDSRTRRMHTEKNYWLHEVGLVVVDESHIISTSRGHAVESGLMRFSRINRDARILLLSATMPNCDELAGWLSKLNGKDTPVVFSTWRPVVLEMNFVEHPIIPWNSGGGMNYKATQQAKRNIAVQIVTGNHPDARGKDQEKFLIFCHDKGTGRNIVKRLEQIGVQAFFHSADLEMEQRLNVERLFEDRNNGIRVLVSTSTLAWGRNLPARNVIIVGCHRGLQEVDELDIIQMAGRAGRYGIDPAGTVYMICPEGSIDKWEYTFKNPRPVRSWFINHDPKSLDEGQLNSPVLSFHLLAEIENQAVKSVKEVIRWWNRSLAHHQEPDAFGMDDAKDLLDDLREMEMLEYRGDYIKPYITGLGRVSAWLYFSPTDVYGWYKNFSKYFDLEPEKRNDAALCWAMTDIESNNWGYIPRDAAEEADAMRYELRKKGIMASDAVVATVAAFKCITGKKGERSIGIFMRSLIYDINRISQAIGLVDKMHAKWEKKEIWATLGQRVMYGVTEEMVELTKVPGVGGATARKLFERGIKTIMDLANQDNLSLIMQIASPARAKKFMAEARKLA